MPLYILHSISRSGEYTFPTAERLFPTAEYKFPTAEYKFPTAEYKTDTFPRQIQALIIR